MTAQVSVRNALFALALTLTAPVAVLAQDTPTFDPSTVVVTAADGSTTEYKINDLGVYLSSNPGYDDVPASVDFSLSFVVISPIDAKLLEWAAQANTDTQNRDIAIVAKVPNADGTLRELRYDITGAHISSLSTNHSTYAQPTVSLSLMADTLAIDGITMK